MPLCSRSLAPFDALFVSHSKVGHSSRQRNLIFAIFFAFSSFSRQDESGGKQSNIPHHFTDISKRDTVAKEEALDWSIAIHTR